ncbi:aminotransferase class I/II-fold pyridoxal phosphate-dependent enzyme [uncultured Shewanella sp.]|uniref:aminotransferase class I/II-fold pyridoxal phosphate-dependent enzyme n=1 Tax=uncultured Shewanella sp. TaxID=173975 RepID=UPI00261474CA|nr:aminotransferase class I/II-fold pyridoxal phosphate-dependent enzyme [uncultured Shewanella sp.]
MTDFYNYMDNMVKDDLLHIELDNITEQGKYIHIKEKKLRHYGSCSYLCIEHDERLKKAAIAEILTSGTQVSASRAYISHPLYLEVEQRLSKMYDAHVLLTSTTTLGHFSAIPALVEADDLVLIDHQAHASMQLATKILQASGISIKHIPHNDIHAIDLILNENQHKRKIWYLTDGVFSMYGDLAPLDELNQLLKKYNNFWLYIDDAHGAGWLGQHGKGYVLGKQVISEKMIVTISFAKCFGVTGGGIIFPNETLYKTVRYCGPTFTFGGPIQPANLAALNASLKIFNSQEQKTLQAQLTKTIDFFNQEALKRNLPLIDSMNSPIRFIGIGDESVTTLVIKKLMQEGIYVNLGIFPAVGKGKSGLRIALNISHTQQEITVLCDLIHNIIKQSIKAIYSDNSHTYIEQVLLKSFENNLSHSIKKKLINDDWSTTNIT